MKWLEIRKKYPDKFILNQFIVTIDYPERKVELKLV
jgi:hypothetical protein